MKVTLLLVMAAASAALAINQPNSPPTSTRRPSTTTGKSIRKKQDKRQYPSGDFLAALSDNIGPGGDILGRLEGLELQQVGPDAIGRQSRLGGISSESLPFAHLADLSQPEDNLEIFGVLMQESLRKIGVDYNRFIDSEVARLAAGKNATPPPAPTPPPTPPPTRPAPAKAVTASRPRPRPKQPPVKAQATVNVGGARPPKTGSRGTVRASTITLAPIKAQALRLLSTVLVGTSRQSSSQSPTTPLPPPPPPAPTAGPGVPPFKSAFQPPLFQMNGQGGSFNYDPSFGQKFEGQGEFDGQNVLQYPLGGGFGGVGPIGGGDFGAQFGFAGPTERTPWSNGVNRVEGGGPQIPPTTGPGQGATQDSWGSRLLAQALGSSNAKGRRPPPPLAPEPRQRLQSQPRPRPQPQPQPQQQPQQPQQQQQEGPAIPPSGPPQTGPESAPPSFEDIWNGAGGVTSGSGAPTGNGGQPQPGLSGPTPVPQEASFSQQDDPFGWSHTIRHQTDRPQGGEAFSQFSVRYPGLAAQRQQSSQQSGGELNFGNAEYRPPSFNFQQQLFPQQQNIPQQQAVQQQQPFPQQQQGVQQQQPFPQQQQGVQQQQPFPQQQQVYSPQQTAGQSFGVGPATSELGFSGQLFAVRQPPHQFFLPQHAIVSRSNGPVTKLVNHG